MDTQDLGLMDTQDLGLTPKRRGGYLVVALALTACALFSASSVDLADAKTFTGTKKADKLIGTKKRDKISGKAGNDRIVGKQGADTLKGGGGKDTIDAADGARDKMVNGGPGRDTCKVDAVDRTRGCEKVMTVGGGGSGGSGSGSGGSGGGSGSSGGGGGQSNLGVTLAEGTSCAANTPLLPCLFLLNGTGADSLTGTVTGVGGVTVAAGVALSVQGDGWNATGAYSCTSNGFLRVTIGPEAIDVPVTCTSA